MRTNGVLAVSGMPRYGIWLVLFALMSVHSGFAQDKTGPADEPVEGDFVRKTAQEYYDALIRKDFRKTAEREVFSVLVSSPDLVAYSRAMQQHPYVGAERIVVLIASLDASGAYLDLRITAGAGITTNRMTWSLTGTPRRWVVQMTQMTMASMPGY